MNQRERIEIEVVLNDQNVLRALDRVIGRLDDLRGTMGRINGSLTETDGFLERSADNFDLFGTTISLLEEPLKALVGKIAFLKGPLGILIGVVGIAGLAGAFRDASGEAQVLDDRLGDLRDRLDADRQAHEDNVEGIRTRNRSLERSIDTIRELTGEEDLSVDEKNRLRIATDYVNDTLARYGDLIGVSSIGLGENNEEALQSIENFKEQSRHADIMNEHVERLIHLHGEQLEASEALPTIAARYMEAQGRLAAYRVEMAELTADQEIHLGYMDESTERYLELTRSISNAESEVYLIRGELDEQIKILKNAAEGIEELENAHKVEFTKMYMHVQEHGLTLGALNDRQLEVVARGVEQWRLYADLSGEMFRKVGEDNALSLREIRDNQDANYKATKDWQDNLALLYEVYGAEVYQHFRDMGEGGMHTVSLMADDIVKTYGHLSEDTICLVAAMEAGIESETTKIVNNMGRSGELATDGLHKSLGEGYDDVIALIEQQGGRANSTLSQDFSAVNFAIFGIAIPEGLIDGVKAGEADALARLQSFAEKLGLCFRTMLGIDKRSIVFEEYGAAIVQGVAKGIRDTKEKGILPMKHVIDELKEVYEVSNQYWVSAGRNVMSGFNVGLLQGEGEVFATAERIANEVSQKMKNALDINSPSRVMREEVGRQIPAGVAVGIDKYADDATDSMADLGTAIKDVTFPSMRDVVDFGPSLDVSVGGVGVAGRGGYSVVNHNTGLFDGAVIHWSGEEDVRRTMEQIAWVTQEESARMW